MPVYGWVHPLRRLVTSLTNSLGSLWIHADSSSAQILHLPLLTRDECHFGKDEEASQGGGWGKCRWGWQGVTDGDGVEIHSGGCSEPLEPRRR